MDTIIEFFLEVFLEIGIEALSNDTPKNKILRRILKIATLILTAIFAIVFIVAIVALVQNISQKDSIVGLALIVIFSGLFGYMCLKKYREIHSIDNKIKAENNKKGNALGYEKKDAINSVELEKNEIRLNGKVVNHKQAHL